MQTSDCLFCRIIRKEISAEVVYEDKKTIAFLDANPKAPGHTMVLPKHHSRNILELPKSEIEPLFSAVKKTSALIEKALKPDGLTIGINQGEASGQEIDHLHIHIFPRFHNDGGGPVQSIVNNLPKKSLKEIAQKIKSATHRS